MKDMQKGQSVEVVGDRYGNNAALDVPENIGKRGVLGDESDPGFWWVVLPNGSQILACETELRPL